MKLQYKAAAIMTLFGTVIVLLLSGGHNIYSHRVIQDKELERIQTISEEIASHVDSHLKEKATIANTLATAPLIKDVLLKSNAEFAAFLENERKQEIDRRNKQWMETEKINDPFVQGHMTNPVAEYLKHQQVIMPGEYGEIFLTNRYGVMIATTGKLTTLAHAHKYWWVACYNGGQGRIFLDDRGFDTSVEGYVLGVVIPVMDENEVIGILKSNVNVMGPLTDVVREFGLRDIGRLRIVRTGGLIVAEHGIAPLSANVSEAYVEVLRKKESCAKTMARNDEERLVAFSPVPSTMGWLGGSEASIDHIKGNKKEGWHIILSMSEEEASKTTRQTTMLILTIGIIMTFVTASVALLLGKWVANPIVELAHTAQTIGEGYLDVRANASSNDEIGSLAKSLNSMSENLQSTMASRDELVSEVKQRKVAEQDKAKTIAELEKAIAEIRTLKGILPICMHCKGIRDDQGYWNRLEEYIAEHSEAQFSHGICEKCLEKQLKLLE